MMTCNCTLPYSNPNACKYCSVMLKEQSEINKDNNLMIPQYPITPFDQWPNTPSKIIKRITRTIDKYDENNKYIGREIITEEIEDVERPIFSYGTTTSFAISSSKNEEKPISNGSSVTYKKDVPFTYTTNCSNIKSECCSN
jgi:hypothetical protein